MSAHTGQPGKTDASRSSVAACSAAPAAHGRSGPLACSGSAGLHPAGPHAGPDPGTPRCSTAGRGRSGCTPGPAPGSRPAHTDTSVPSARRQLQRRWTPQPANPRCASRSSPHSACCARCAEAVDERRPPVQYLWCTVFSTVGCGGTSNCHVVRPPHPSRCPGQHRSTAQRPARARPAGANAPTDGAQRAPLMLEHHCRRLVHGGGRASHTTNERPPRWASRVRSNNLPPGRSAPHRCIQRYKDSARQWVSFGERNQGQLP